MITNPKLVLSPRFSAVESDEQILVRPAPSGRMAKATKQKDRSVRSGEIVVLEPNRLAGKRVAEIDELEHRGPRSFEVKGADQSGETNKQPKLRWRCRVSAVALTLLLVFVLIVMLAFSLLNGFGLAGMLNALPIAIILFFGGIPVVLSLGLTK